MAFATFCADAGEGAASESPKGKKAAGSPAEKKGNCMHAAAVAASLLQLNGSKRLMLLRTVSVILR